MEVWMGLTNISSEVTGHWKKRYLCKQKGLLNTVGGSQDFSKEKWLCLESSKFVSSKDNPHAICSYGFLL